jgi:hypothetical protein
MYYFSGVDRAGFIELLAREGAAGMVNASVATQPAMMAACSRWPEVPLVLDSGAFQGNTDVDEYARICTLVGSRFRWVATLDVIGDQDASDRNWTLLKAKGIHPLWVYQVQGGRDLYHMEKAAETLKHIGVGGLVPLLKENPQHVVDMIGEIGERLGEVGAKAHFFGVGSPLILKEYAWESWFASADSQSWLCGFKSRELISHSGRRFKCDAYGLELTREECAAQNVRQVHSWTSGEPMQLALL